MIFITSMGIGLCAGMTRSAFSIALAAALIPVAFGAAAVLSTGPVSWLSLIMAVAGYNAGLINLVVGMLIMRRPVHA